MLPFNLIPGYWEARWRLFSEPARFSTKQTVVGIEAGVLPAVGARCLEGKARPLSWLGRKGNVPDTHGAQGIAPQHTLKGILRRVMEEQAIIAHLPLADSIARKYDRQAADQQETILVARLALMKATRVFEPQRHPHFMVFAQSLISEQIQRHRSSRDSMAHTSAKAQELRAEIVREFPLMCRLLGRRPTLSELAGQLGQSTEAVAEAMGREEQPLEGQLLDVADDDFAVWGDSLVLVEAVGKLSVQEKKLLYLRYFEQQSQQRIGEEIGASQVQVSRALARLLMRLQHYTLIPSPDSAPQGSAAAGVLEFRVT